MIVTKPPIKLYKSAFAILPGACGDIALYLQSKHNLFDKLKTKQKIVYMHAAVFKF